MGRQPTETYESGLDDPQKQATIAQQRLRSNIIGLRINKYLTTDDKINLRAFKSAYTFNSQYYGATICFVIVKIVRPNTHSGCSDIKSKLDNMNMSQFKDDNPKVNLKIS